MTDKNNISRKKFIKNCSATLGMLSLGMPHITAKPYKKPFYVGNQSIPAANNATLRGSWVRIGQHQQGDILLNACTIIVDENEHTAVQQAAKFLAEDLFKISGYKPHITTKNDHDNNVTIVLTTLGKQKLPSQINSNALQDKKEAYHILTTANTVWLIGADFRGTAYAAYTLSERLGIDPLYLWTGYRPQHNPELVIKKTDHYEGQPTVKYRGFFHDDEDILPRPFDKFGYPLRIGNVPMEWYQRFFETALRLRMNMVAPYVRVHRRYEVQKCASDWGLYYTSHHYDILLSNPFGIERFFLADKRGVSTSWDWYKSKDNMVKYWRGGVEENQGVNAIWPVGLRGTDDHAYEFPKDTPEKEQARVFKEAIDIQVKTVKELTPAHEAPVFHFTLYTEMLEKYRKHPEEFNVPPDVILVWPDNNDGIMRDLPSGHDQWKHGVYYHLAYFGGAPTKQAAHIVTPARVTEQFKQIINAGATEFMLVNVTEMREFIMEARLIADICWDASTMLNKNNPADEYVTWWCKEYFGADAGALAAKCYQQYYDLLNSSEQLYFGATQFEAILEKLYKRFTKQSYNQPDAARVSMLNSRAIAYESAFKTIEETLSHLNREQKQFFFEHVMFALRADQRPTQAALILLKALVEPNDDKAWELIAEAMVPLEKLEVDILRAERPPFEGWYRPTWIKTYGSPFNIHRSYTQLRSFIGCEGMESPIKVKEALGHNIEGARLWTRYMEDAERIKASY